jgi:FMN-dependent NADH-azoreductase
MALDDTALDNMTLDRGVTCKYLTSSVTGRYHKADRKSRLQLPFLLHVLAFLGTTDVEVIDVEGTAFGPQAAEQAVAAALAAVGTVALGRRAA